MIRGDDEKRFWSKTKRSGACVVWVGSVDKDGYGKFVTGPHGAQKHHRAHRWIFERLIRMLESGEVLRHRCDNPRCVNVSHHIGGSQFDNVHDALSRGRRKQVMTPELVKRARMAYVSKSLASMSRETKINYLTLYTAATYKTWKHIK